jgi:monovalent cation:H+ antiporter-2, CPA2 family
MDALDSGDCDGDGAMHESLLLRDLVIVLAVAVAVVLLLARLRLPSIAGLNPASVAEAGRHGQQAYFGDVTSPEVLEHLGLRRARGLVLLINDAGALERAVSAAHALAPDVPIAVRARYVGDIRKLERAGATEVVAAELEAGRALIRRVLARLAKDESRAQG